MRKAMFLLAARCYFDNVEAKNEKLGQCKIVQTCVKKRNGNPLKVGVTEFQTHATRLVIQ
jgi:hypothetical protein